MSFARTTSARTTSDRAPWPGRVAVGVKSAAVRALFGTLDRVAPDRGALRALDIWCTLPGNAGRRKDLRPEPGRVERLDLEHGDVVVETWGDAAAPAVLLVHGWGGWRGQLGAFIAPLLAAGNRVVAFDVPGHGEAAPGRLGERRGNVMEFIEALTAVGATQGPVRGIVAHSMGCAVAADVVRAGLVAERLVLVAPSPDFREITVEFGRVLGFGERTRSRLQQVMEEFCVRSLASFDLGPMGPVVPPTLVVHDRRDKESPYAVGERLADAWDSATLLATDGLGHQRILADPHVIDRAVRYVTDRHVADRSRVRG